MFDFYKKDCRECACLLMLRISLWLWQNNQRHFPMSEFGSRRAIPEFSAMKTVMCSTGTQGLIPMTLQTGYSPRLRPETRNIGSEIGIAIVHSEYDQIPEKQCTDH